MLKPNQPEEVRVLRMKLGCGLREAYHLIVKYGTASAALAAVTPQTTAEKPLLGSELHRKQWENARQVLEVSDTLYKSPVENFHDLPQAQGILRRLIHLASYQQQQIEALYRALQVVADHDKAIYDNPLFQQALTLRPAEGEFPDVEDDEEHGGEED